GRRIHPGRHRHLDRVQARARAGRGAPAPAPVRVRAVFRPVNTGVTKKGPGQSAGALLLCVERWTELRLAGGLLASVQPGAAPVGARPTLERVEPGVPCEAVVAEA